MNLWHNYMGTIRKREPKQLISNGISKLYVK